MALPAWLGGDRRRAPEACQKTPTRLESLRPGSSSCGLCTQALPLLQPHPWPVPDPSPPTSTLFHTQPVPDPSPPLHTHHPHPHTPTHTHTHHPPTHTQTVPDPFPPLPTHPHTHAHSHTTIQDPEELVRAAQPPSVSGSALKRRGKTCNTLTAHTQRGLRRSLLGLCLHGGRARAGSPLRLSNEGLSEQGLAGAPGRCSWLRL